MGIHSQYIDPLKDRIYLHQIPFSERGSRLLIFQSDKHLTIRLAERGFKQEGQLAAYRRRTLDLICCHAVIDEYHHPIRGENPPTVASMFGCSPGMFVDLAIQPACEKSQ